MIAPTRTQDRVRLELASTIAVTERMLELCKDKSPLWHLKRTRDRVMLK